jgi:hypothetical protein
MREKELTKIATELGLLLLCGTPQSRIKPRFRRTHRFRVWPGSGLAASGRRGEGGSHAGSSDQSSRGRKPKSLGFVIELAPVDARLGTRGLRSGIDPDGCHFLQIDHHAVVTNGKAG